MERCIKRLETGEVIEVVTRQYERPGHQQRLLQTFIEDVFIFSLLVYIAHWSFLDDALYIYLLTYLLTYLVLAGVLRAPSAAD